MIVTRTFSKIFGMAGARVGYVMARPDLLKKLQLYDGGNLSGQLPVAVGGLRHRQPDGDKAMIAQRRKELMSNRAMTVDFLTKRNFKVIGPSEANMVMVDWKTKIGQGNAGGVPGPGRGDRRPPLADLADRVAHLHRLASRTWKASSPPSTRWCRRNPKR